MGSHSRGILSVILSVALGVTPVHGSADLLADGEAGTDRPRPAGTDLGRFLHVDLWTGALECVQGDLPGFERTWRSDLPAHLSGDLGTGWRHLYEIDLVRDEAGDPCLVDGGGRVVSFPGASATAGAEAAHGPADRLEPRDGGWRLRRVDGSLVDLDATGRAERIVSAEGLEQRLSYGADGALEAVLEGEREVLRFRHGEGGGLAAVQSLGGAAEDGSPPMSPPVSGAYFLRDAAGRLAGVERFAAGEAGRGRVDYGYDEAGRLVRVRPAGCVEARVLYDGAGRVAALEGDGVLPRTYAWEETAEGLQVEVVDGAGATVRIRFLEGGRRVEMEDPSGALTEVLLDHRRMPTAVRGPAGRLGLRYDAAGRLVDVALPDGGTEGYAYDEAGRLAARVDRRGNRTVYERDEAGRTIKVRHPDGSVEGATWDAAGRLASHRSALGAVTHHAYDDRGLLRSVSVEGGTTTLYDHDAAGRLRSVATPLGEVVRLAYDGAGRLVRVSGPGGAETYEYDAAGEVVAATDGAGRRTALERDGLGRVVGRRGPLGEDLRLDYDGAGRVVAVVDGLGERTRYRRDALGRAVEVVDPDGASTRFAYDAAGRVVERSDPSGAVRLGYDERGRLAVRTGPGGDEARFEYDAAGDLARARSEGADLGWRRDALGRVVEVVDRVLERSVHYGWAPGGLRTSLATPEVELRYDYDARGRMVAVQGPGGTTRWDLDAAGRRTRVRNPNGVETRYERDLAGRVVEAETVAPSGPLERWAYAYDDAGRVVRVEGPEGEARLAYDEAGRLAREERDGAVARRYGYDAAGNRLEAAGEVTYVHDEAGRVVERQGPEGATRFAWDVHGRLVGAEAPDGRVERYGYAPDGRRLWRERDGRRVRYLHDGENLLAEYAQDGSCLATYVHGDGLDDVLGVLRAGQRWACHTDGRTNLTALTDGEGAVAARYRYDAFGVPLVEEEPFELPYRYASASWDGLAGVYPMRARPYDPRAGRFLSKDPLGQAGGLNLYAYVGNDPAGRVDPWGLSGEESVWGRIGGWFEGAGRWTAGAARDTWAVAREVPGVVWEDVASGGARDRIYAFGRGLGYGVVDAGKGLGQMVLHPVDTLSGLKDAVVNWDQTAAAVGRLVDDYWEAARSDPERFAEMTGRLTAEIELAIVGAKGLDKLAKARQIQRLRGVVAARSAAVARTAGRAARGSSVGRVLAPVARRVGAAATVTGAALGGAARAVGSGLSSAGGAVRQGMSRAGATARAAAERARERLAVLRGRRPPRRGVKDALDDMAGGKKGGGGPAAGEASGLTAAQARAISREFQEALGRHLRPGVALTDEVFDAAFDDMARVAARHGIEMTMSRDVARSAIRKAFLGDASRALADGQVMDALNSYLAAAAAPPALWPESATRLSMMLRKTNPLIADPMKVLGHEFTHAAHASMARAIARRMGMGADETARFLREFEKTNLTTFERAASRMGALAKNGGDAGAYARELASFTDEMTEALIAGRNLEYSAGLVHDLKAIVGTHTGTILLGAGAYAYWQSTR